MCACWCSAIGAATKPTPTCAIIESGRGDVPLTELRFRCSQRDTDRTDFVVSRWTTRNRGERRETPSSALQALCKRPHQRNGA